MAEALCRCKLWLTKYFMDAIVITKPGAPDVLKMVQTAQPEAQRGEVLVKVYATAVNRADLLQRAGHYPAPIGVPKDIPGLEFAGEIAAIGEAVNEWNLGDRVFGLVGGGSYAQYLVTHARALSRIPENISYEEAAALPEACITAYDAMVTQGALSAGESLLINGVTSGVGTMAVQIANAIGAEPIGTTRSEHKASRLADLGLKKVIIVQQARFAGQVISLAGESGVDLVLELLGGDYIGEDLQCLAVQGRLVVVGLLAGASTNLDLAKLLAKRLHIIGTNLRARPLEQKITAMRTFAKSVVPLIAAKKIKPVIDKIFPLNEAVDAHKYLAANESFGKVVLTVRN